MRYLYILLILLFVGCATEHTRKRNFHQYVSPDKFKLQMNVNTDDSADNIDQVRFGFDWNLQMDKLNKKSVIFIIVFGIAALMFVIDPFDWVSMPEVGKECSPMSLYPRCTGKINFF